MIKMYRMYRDDVEITNKKHGLVIKSQNGKRWRIKANNNGELYTEEVVFGEEDST
jgi:hypothetical protein